MQRFTSFYVLLLFASLSNCDYYAHKNIVPFFTQRVLDTLPAEKHPVKIELDLMHKHLYWLNKMGEIYRIQPDGTQVELVNKGFGADMGITYIEDFSLDAAHDRMYFTDIFDLESGNSAIKQSNLDGNNIKTITTFDHETPFQIASKPGSNTIYYVTQTKQNLEMVYRLGAIQEDTREKTILYTSTESFNLSKLPDFSLGNEYENMMTDSHKPAYNQLP